MRRVRTRLHKDKIGSADCTRHLEHIKKVDVGVSFEIGDDRIPGVYRFIAGSLMTSAVLDTIDDRCTDSVFSKLKCPVLLASEMSGFRFLVFK